MKKKNQLIWKKYLKKIYKMKYNNKKNKKS